jgi:uncharacterized damage-inducible protein DinB
MSDLEEQILETWRIHQRTMMFLIRNIPEEALSATLSTRGGRDVARQLAHVHNIRVQRLASFAKKIGSPLQEFDKDESPHQKALLDAFEQSGGVMERYIEQSLQGGATASNFKKGIVPMLGYHISHEAHHRGHLLLTMKQCGFRLSDALRWGLWDWNKL